MLTDNYGRNVSSLRVQVNTTCNFGCFFCHMEGTGIQANEMSTDQILRIIETAHKLGINKVKFTGGEPTLRRDIVEIVRRTRSIITGDISMTTNGTRLKQLASDLRKAGLDRINVSMHSIDREGFRFITGVDAIEKVLEGIESARNAGFENIKVNFVALNGVNIDQIPRMIELSAKEKFLLQIIEYEVPREQEASEDYVKYHYPLDDLEAELSSRSYRIDHNSIHERPVFRIRNEIGEASVEIVKPMRNYEFCNKCTRMRVTSLGELKPCLMTTGDLTPVFRRGKETTDEEIESAFMTATLKRKPYWTREDNIESQVLCETERAH
ncbi:MAG: GTP 3',8-cyclase MoaA [Candidatus Thermoplasmatota archaeon]|nr:GTP 3',8-cyclase MoaA [Candidatus Thermoplasmatota archaeon]